MGIKIIKFSITLLSVAFVVVYFKVNLGTIFTKLVHIDYFFLCLTIPFVIQYISANRWSLLLNQIGIEERKFSLIKINCISMFQGLAIPSSQGYDFFRIYYIEKRHPSKRGAAGSTIIIERFIGLILLVALSLCFSFLNNTIYQHKSVIVVISLISAMVLLLIIGLYAYPIVRKWLNLGTFKNKLLHSLFSYLNQIITSLNSFPYRKIFATTSLLILGLQLLTICSVFLLFNAFGYSIPFAQHIALYPIVGILSMIPVTISGLGFREGFFVYFYSKLGIPADVIVVVSLLNFAILVLMPAIFGVFFYFSTLFGHTKQ